MKTFSAQQAKHGRSQPIDLGSSGLSARGRSWALRRRVKANHASPAKQVWW